MSVVNEEKHNLISSVMKNSVLKKFSALMAGGAAAFVIALSPVILKHDANAAVYYYQDETGRVHITDSPPHKGYKVIIPSSKEQISISDSPYNDRQTKYSPENPAVKANVQAKKQSSAGGENLKKSIANTKFYEVDDSKFAVIISRYAQVNDLPYNLVKAIIKAESDFNPNCTSRVGAMGLMQLMPGTAKYVGVSVPYDPEQNIMGGTKYFRQMLNTFRDLELAIAAYNAGPTTVIKAGRKIPNIRETQNYVKKVLFYYDMFSKNNKPFTDSEKNNRLAIIYYRRGEIKKSITEFKKVINLSPNYAPARYNLGYIYSQEGEYSKAIEMYKQAIKLDPYMKSAYYNLAITLERRGLLDMAIATWSTYISYETDSEKIAQAKKYIDELKDYISTNQR